MESQTKKIEPFRAADQYGKWLLRELQTQGITLLVVGENGLQVKGEMTVEQREIVRLWKKQLINELSPKCSNCSLPMDLIENGKRWLCRMGCVSLEVK